MGRCGLTGSEIDSTTARTGVGVTSRRSVAFSSLLESQSARARAYTCPSDHLASGARQVALARRPATCASRFRSASPATRLERPDDAGEIRIILHQVRISGGGHRASDLPDQEEV